MTRWWNRFADWRSRQASSLRYVRARRLALEALDGRHLLCGVHSLIDAESLFVGMNDDDGVAVNGVEAPPEGLPPVVLGPEPFRPPGTAAAAPPVTAPNGLPLLESKPDAAVAVYLDFDGFSGNGFGGNQTFAPYSINSDATTYNAQEQTNIIEGWKRIAAHFAPFDVNVTTIVPSVPFSWSVITPTVTGAGYSYLQFNGPAPSSFNPQNDLLSRTSGILHEIGHNFGLQHQSDYDLLGNKTKEYRNGYDNLHSPIMGVDFDGTVPKWYLGHPADSPSVLQDDIAGIVSKIIPHQGPGGDGFRTDDFPGTIAAATALPVSSGVQSTYGIIERMSDVDMFAFTSDGGAVAIDATRDSLSGLDMKLQVFAADGTLLQESDTAATDQHLVVSLPAGTYFTAVSSHGDYSDIGPYNLVVQSLPAGWQHQDIGNVGQAGYVTYTAATETFGVGGSGTQIGSTSDSFHFAYQKLTGDGEIIARVTAVENTNASAKSGVMIRETLVAGSRFAYMLTSPTNGTWLRSRAATNGNAADTPRADEPFAPIWVRLVREGNALTGYSSTDGTNWTLEGTTTVSMTPTVFIGLATTATNNGVVNDSTYDHVSLVGALGDPPPALNALPSPAGLTVTASTGTSIALSWTDVAGETGYTIERSADGAVYASAGTTNAGVTTFNNTGLTNFQRYFYRVRANDATGVSAASSVLSGVTRPGAVSNLTVTSWTDTKLILNWRDRSGETGYRIDRSTDGTTFATLATVGVNVLSYTDSGLTPGTTYYYKVATLDAAGTAATTSAANAATRVSAISGLAFSEIAADHISLAWNDATSETGYLLERSINGTDYTTLATLAAGTTSYVDSTVASSSEYYYRIVGQIGTTPGLSADAVFAGTPGAAPLPSPWIAADVGTVTGRGASGVADGVYTLISAGSDLENTTDSFHFLYQPLAGDGAIIARVASIENTDDNAEVGLMVRESLANNSKSFAVVATPANGAKLRYRSSTGGNSATGGSGADGPQWFKLVRSGNTFSGFTSNDGNVWTQIGNNITISMTSSVFIGLAAISHDSDVLNTATFDSVVVGTPTPLARDDGFSVAEDAATSGELLVNDLNLGASGAVATLVAPPVHGAATVATDGGFTYTPNSDYFGVDVFMYRVATPVAVIVPTNARWKYLDNGSNQGTAWRDTSFLDTAWASGPAELGYGDGDEATTVASGPANARFATTYFRKTIDLPTGAATDSLSMRLKRDDAAAVYINGVEVYRDANLPAGAAFNTYATSDIPSGQENTFVTIPLPGVSLDDGANTIAVEIHQGNATSSDVGFNLELSGRLLSSPATATITVTPTPDLPTAHNDAFETNAGQAISVPPAGVLLNDVDVDGDTLVALVKSQPTSGTLSLAVDGSFTYTPNPSFVGDDTFTYVVTDGTSQSLVESGSEWRYLDNGSNQFTAWREPGFVDTAWATGAAELGYGEDDEATDVNCGPSAPDCNADNFATTYFRRRFDVPDASRVGMLQLTIRRDDAAAVYLNGHEIFRDANLPPGVAFNDFATSSSDENETTTIAVDAVWLESGANVFAVEVHQSSATSSDISFDLSLVGKVLSNAATVTITVLPGTTPTPGDFNGDDRVTVADLDLLVAAIAGGSNDPLYDVTGDHAVTRADLDRVVTELVETTIGVGTRYGDIDLSGDVNRQDAFLFSQQFGRSGSPSWSAGDFDADAVVGLGDMAILQANLAAPPVSGESPAAAASAVVARAANSLRSAERRLAISAAVRRRADHVPRANERPALADEALTSGAISPTSLRARRVARSTGTARTAKSV